MKRIAFILSLSAILIRSFSQGIDNDNFILTHGPWLQNMGTSEVTIIWTTNKPAIPGITLTLPDGKTRFVRNSHDGMIDGGGTLHKVKIDGLLPATTYKYSLNSVQILKYQAYKVYYGDTLRGKQISFNTMPSQSPNVCFTVFNDVHELSGKMASYLKHNDITSQDLYFFNGDMMDWLQDPEELYLAFLDTASFYFAGSKPFIYIRGNHETRGYAARELKKWFDYKDDRFYYSFTYGPCHFTVLDSGEDKEDNNKNYYGLADYDTYRLEELKWLKEEIESIPFKSAKYRIVMVHQPILRAENQNYAMTFLSENFGPVLKKADIDLMMSAHTHRNSFYEKDKTGYGYPLLVNSNNSFVEVNADNNQIKAVVKDVEGKVISEYDFK
ncbi:MAG: metallophosphoesterase [Bacteroidia bacterium]|nr:metallophosphoesterase [Bacteroidia bacterium]